MKRMNNNTKLLFFIVMCFSFLKLLSILNIISMIKSIDLIFWFIIFIMGIIFTYHDYKRYKDVSNSIVTILIILLIYFMLYFSIGLILGYSYNAYSGSLKGNIMHIILLIVPIFFQEYIRAILVDHSAQKKKIRVLITLLYIIIGFNYSNIVKFDSPEVIFKMICNTLIPLIATEFLMTHLSSIGGYKLTSVYKIIVNSFIILIPIVPKIHFTVNCILLVILPVVTFIAFDNFEENAYYYQGRVKNNNILEYILLFAIFTPLVVFSLGITKYQMFAIMSNSMNPLYYKGDAVLIKELTDEEKQKLKVGDIIVVKDEELIIHRIHKVIGDDVDPIYVTKGDNNNNIDSKRITKKDIKGKYIFHIKFLGYPRVYLNNLLSD